MAGYSGAPLIRKLGFKEGHRLFFHAAPESFLVEISPLPNGATIHSSPKSIDAAVLFVTKESEYRKVFAAAAKKLDADGMIWVAWPKKASKKPTDLEFANVQKIGLDAGLVDVKVCAIDDVWSGLKFVFRKADRARIRNQQ